MYNLIVSALTFLSYAHYQPAKRYVEEYSNHCYPILRLEKIPVYVVNHIESPFLISQNNNDLLGIGFAGAISLFVNRKDLPQSFFSNLIEKGYHTVLLVE